MTAPAPDLDLEGIEARANAATPGPWRHHIPDKGYCIDYVLTDHPDYQGDQKAPWGNYVAETSIAPGREQNFTNDARFIAASRTDIPALLAALRAATARAEEAEKHIEDIVQERLDEMDAEGEAFEKESINALKFVLQRHCGNAGNDLLHDHDGWSADGAIECIAECFREVEARAEKAEREVATLKEIGDGLANGLAGKLAKPDGKTIIDFMRLWTEQARDAERKAKAVADAATSRADRLEKRLQRAVMALSHMLDLYGRECPTPEHAVAVEAAEDVWKKEMHIIREVNLSFDGGDFMAPESFVLTLDKDELASVRTALQNRAEAVKTQMEEDYYHNIDADGRRCSAIIARIDAALEDQQ